MFGAVSPNLVLFFWSPVFEHLQVTEEFFFELMGDDVEPKDAFIGCRVDQGGTVLNVIKWFEIPVLKCAARRLNTVVVWALGVGGSD